MAKDHRLRFGMEDVDLGVVGLLEQVGDQLDRGSGFPPFLSVERVVSDDERHGCYLFHVALLGIQVEFCVSSAEAIPVNLPTVWSAGLRAIS